ncbi:hypothetical protein [Salibacterium sp. K-3]
MKPEHAQRFIETFEDQALREQLECMIEAAYRTGYQQGYKAKEEETGMGKR